MHFSRLSGFRGCRLSVFMVVFDLQIEAEILGCQFQCAPHYELVHDPYKQDVVRALDKKESAPEIFNMKDYGQADKVIVDIITLDSESSAPCQYMVEAVKKVAPQFEGVVEWRGHAIKKMDAVTLMSSLMVKNIPTICFGGKIVFVSKIPPKGELIAAIQKRIYEKLKLKIKSERSEILMLCSDKNEYKSLNAKINCATT